MRSRRHRSSSYRTLCRRTPSHNRSSLADRRRRCFRNSARRYRRCRRHRSSCCRTWCRRTPHNRSSLPDRHRRRFGTCARRYRRCHRHRSCCCLSSYRRTRCRSTWSARRCRCSSLRRMRRHPRACCSTDPRRCRPPSGADRLRRGGSAGGEGVAAAEVADRAPPWRMHPAAPTS